jgi:hypothetical protein
MHELMRTDDGINRAGAAAMRAADAQRLIDNRDRSPRWLGIGK